MGPRRVRVDLREVLPTLAALADTEARLGAALTAGHELLAGYESWTAAIEIEDVRAEISSAESALRSMEALLAILGGVRLSLCTRLAVRRFRASTREMRGILAALHGRARQLGQLESDTRA